MTRKGEWAADLRQPGPEDQGGGVDVPQLVQNDLGAGLRIPTPLNGLKTIYCWLAGTALFLRRGSMADDERVRATTCQALVTDIHLRAEMGKKKYGVRLHTNNGRDALLDAYQEILDALSYIRQELEERGEGRKHNARPSIHT